MSKQPEALRLADELEADWHKAQKSGQVLLSSADELRRLHAANVELVQALKSMKRGYVNLLEGGRDRIIALGGDCDSVERMRADNPYLKDADEAIQKHGGQS